MRSVINVKMIKMFFGILVMFSMLLCSGCFEGKNGIDYSLSMNQQRSLIRAGADNAVTAVFDYIDSQDDVSAYTIVLEGITKEIQTFISTGDVSALTMGQIKVKLIELVPKNYRILSDQLLLSISFTEVNVEDYVGTNNIKRLLAVCNGILEGIAHYKMEDRKG